MGPAGLSFRFRNQRTSAQKNFMIPNTKKLSVRKRTRWDQHCMLVIQFPISLQAEIRRNARIAELTRGLRQNLERFASRWALDFFRHPSTIAQSLGFDSSGKNSGSQESSQHTNTVLPA